MISRDAKHGESRRGAALVESAIVLAVCLVLFLGMLELNIALMKHTALAEAARRVARAAIVHGAKATAAHGRWGPGSIATTAAGNEPAAVVARDILMATDPSQVQIAIDWIDGGNQPDQRIQVTLSTIHRPVVPIPVWYTELHLRSVSTMRIAH